MDDGWEEAEDASGWERLAIGCATKRLPELDVTVGVVVGTDGLLVVDTGSTLGDGARLRREIRELTGRAVTHVALTHGHFDHVFGTAAFSGVEVYGDMALDGYLAERRHELRADAVRHGIDPHAAAEAADVLVRPDHLVDRRCEFDLGAREVLLASAGPAHTGHDLAVVVRGTPTVVFCGDLVEESGEPQAGPDSTPGAWPAAMDRLLELGGETAVYVPGHGAVVDARFVREQRDQLAARFGVS